MIAETTLVSCNHVAPVATTNELDAVSVISADRSSTDSVGACSGHAHAGDFSACACEDHALTEECDKMHVASKELDIDHLNQNVDVVKVRCDLHHEHAPDLDVVYSGLETKSSTACMIPKSKSSSALQSGPHLYSLVDKDVLSKLRKVDENGGSNVKQVGKKHDSFDDEMEMFLDVKKSKSDAEVAQYTKSDYGNKAGEDAMHDIKSPSLRNLLQSFIGKIDRLSPKKDGDSQDFIYNKELNDGGSNWDETELTEFAPLLIDANDSGLASAPSRHNILQQATPAGSGNLYCLKCGQNQSDMSDISLDSFGRSSSLRSYNSLRSERMKSLSRDSGPIIQIAPEDAVFNEKQNISLTKTNGKTVKPLERLFHSGLPSIPKQTVITNHNGKSKIGYVAFSSVDTETSSVGPSTSVSNDSLDSAADLTSDQSAIEPSPKYQEQQNDRSRNVAIDSLRTAKHGKPLKDLTPEVEDSGFGASVGFETSNQEINGQCSSDVTRPDFMLQNGNQTSVNLMQDNAPRAEELGEPGMLFRQNMFEPSSSPDGQEFKSLIVPSPYSSSDINTKRKVLRQVHSCEKIDVA